MKIQLDIPNGLNDKLAILKTEKKFKDKKQAVIFALKEYFRLEVPIKSLEQYFRGKIW